MTVGMEVEAVGIMMAMVAEVIVVAEVVADAIDES